MNALVEASHINVSNGRRRILKGPEIRGTCRRCRQERAK